MSKTSPFAPGYGTRPPHLAGREAAQSVLEEALAKLLADGPNRGLVMYGPRGMGKTVLLFWLADKCREAGITPIYATPATGLQSQADLPKLLLPADWLPDKVALRMGNILTTEWSIKDASGNRQGTLAEHLVSACRQAPRVLLLDEAHTLMDATLYQALLGTAQVVADQAPFLLVLAGTPGLMPHLREIGATFVGRSGKIGIGALSQQAAMDAVRIPLQNAGITIASQAIEAVVEDCQRYPFFLQEWGESLWQAIKDEPRPATVTQGQLAAASEAFRKIKEAFYGDRYQAMCDNRELLIAADAVSKRFQGKTRLNPDELTVFINRSLAELIPDEKARDARAVQLEQELNRMDYFWYPPDGDQAEPGIPSFMTYVSDRYAEKQALEQAPP